MNAAADPNASPWERGFDLTTRWVPYVTLAVSAVLSVVARAPTDDPWPALGLAAVAAIWTATMFTIPHRRGGVPQGRLRLYLVGVLILALILMLQHPLFFVYVITGFFHAFLLRPFWLVVVGIALTSLVINSMIVIPDGEAEAWTIFSIIVVVQTAAISFGGLGSEKMAEKSEERRRAVAELEAALEENAGLHAQLVAQAHEAGVLDERQRMAREIHDTLAQGLTGVITQLEAARQTRSDEEAVARHLENAVQLARDSLSEARRSVHQIRPQPLENSRLAEAVSDIAARWAAITGVDVDVATTGVVRPLHPEVEVTLLRVAQEGLANVGKHASASRAGITLSFMDDLVALDVRDDGMGLDASGNGGGFGLVAMRQRIESLAGSMSIESDGAGTAVSVTIPTSHE